MNDHKRKEERRIKARCFHYKACSMWNEQCPKKCDHYINVAKVIVTQQRKGWNVHVMVFKCKTKSET